MSQGYWILLNRSRRRMFMKMYLMTLLGFITG